MGQTTYTLTYSAYRRVGVLMILQVNFQKHCSKLLNQQSW